MRLLKQISKYHKIKLFICSLTRMAISVRGPKPSCKQACCPNLAPPRAHAFLLGILKAEVLLHWGQRTKLWDVHHRDLKASSEQHKWLVQTRAGRRGKSPEGPGAQSSIASPTVGCIQRTRADTLVEEGTLQSYWSICRLCMWARGTLSSSGPLFFDLPLRSWEIYL